MDPPTIDLVKKTVPSQFHHRVDHIFVSSRDSEEQRRKASESRPKRFNRGDIQSTSEEKSKHTQDEINVSASALGIARVVMELWSAKMYRYAEDLILNKAIQEKYIEEKHLKFIRLFGEDLNEKESTGWVIQDQDEVVIDLLWKVLKLKEHFDEVYRHRLFILKSYDRLKEFLPELHPEIADRHDLSKYAFSQAIGYTLKFIHKTWHPIWKAACELHLSSELHHPQAWSRKFSPEKKLQKLKFWTSVSCDTNGDCPYGMDLTTLSLDDESLPLPFLLESYVDMVAIEWERKKGGRDDITKSELIYMNEKFLMRYNNSQRKRVTELVNHVISEDKSWDAVILSDREKKLLSTVSEKDKNPILFKIKNLKNQELERLKKKLVGPDSGGAGTTFNASKELIKMACDHSFYYNVSLVIMDVWDNTFRRFMEQQVLRRAIKENYIQEEHLKWIFFVDQSEGDEPVLDTFTYDPANYEDIVTLIWEDYKMRDHFSQMKEHRFWLRKSFQRLSKYAPELPEEVIERHDLSKLAFSQAVGYTLKWVHDINSLVWKKACELHLNKEPHHPQMWQQRHKPEYKHKCLELYLCTQADDAKYGIEISQLDLTSENMAQLFLWESFVDMVAVEWERNKNKRDDLTDTELVYMEERFLNRYTANDKSAVQKFMEMICKADKHE